MDQQESEFSPEQVEAVKEIVGELVGWEELWTAYSDHNEGKALDDKPLTEVDLMREILEAGGYQQEGDHTFEDTVMIGTHAIGEEYRLFEEDK